MSLKIKKEWQEKIDIGLETGIRAFFAIIIFALVINSVIGFITNGPPWIQWEKNKIALLQKHSDATLVCGKENTIVSKWELWEVDQAEPQKPFSITSMSQAYVYDGDRDKVWNVTECTIIHRQKEKS